MPYCNGHFAEGGICHFVICEFWVGNKHKLAGNILVEVHSRLTMMLSEKLFSRGYGNCEWTVAVNHGLSFRGLKKEAPFLPVP